MALTLSTGSYLRGNLDCARWSGTFHKLVVQDVALLEKDLCDLLFHFEDGISTTRCPHGWRFSISSNNLLLDQSLF